MNKKLVPLVISFIFGFRMLGLFMIIPVLALQDDTYSNFNPFSLGIALGAYGFTQGILQIPFGIMSDKFGRKRLIYLGLVLFTIGSIVAATAVSMEQLILGRAIQGSGAISGTLLALLADTTGERIRSSAMALVGMFIGIAFLLGMTLGPLITEFYGMKRIFELTASLGIISILLVGAVIDEPKSITKNLELDIELTSIKSLVFDTKLSHLYLSIFMLHLSLMSFFLILPVMLTEDLEHSQQMLPIIYLLLLGGGFLFMLPAMIFYEKRSMQRPLFLASTFSFAAIMFLIPYLSSYSLIITAIFIYFSVFNLLEALLPSLASKLSPAGKRGSVLSIFSTSQFFGTFCGGLFGGYFLQNFGTEMLMSILGCLGLLWFLFSLRFQNIDSFVTVVLDVRSKKNKDLLKIISKKDGIEDILFTNNNAIAYVKFSRSKLDKKIFDDLTYLGDFDGERSK